ncbi:MAG: hypothetical protein K6G43_00065 [Lachnospiraceae bacterium]|nr:hypothetical protein [Lachnospiraceae bacterium]
MVLDNPEGGGNPGGGGDPGIPPFDAPVPNGKYSVNISHDNYGGEAMIRFYSLGEDGPVEISSITASADMVATDRISKLLSLYYLPGTCVPGCI